MRNLEAMIGILYKRVSVQSVIDGNVSYNDFDKAEFLRMTNAYFLHYSENEAANLFDYFVDMFYRAAPRAGRQISNKLDVFEPVFHYAQEFLLIRNNEVLCRYSRLPDWRRMTTELSEDMIVTAFLARNVRYSNMQFRGFSWKRVIGHDNAQLNSVIRRGISENHSHLNGAAPIFQISWISLMNNVSNSQFGRLLHSYDEDRRYTNVSYGNSYKETSFYQKYMQAVLIRLMLYSKLSGKRMRIGDYKMEPIDFFEFLRLPSVQFGEQNAETVLSRAVIHRMEDFFEKKNEEEYFLSELILKVLTFYLEERKEPKDKLYCILDFNPELAGMIQGPSGVRTLNRDKARQLLVRNEEALLSQVFLRMLSLTGRIDLEDVEELFQDEQEFQDIWEDRTFSNVKALLRNPEDLAREQNSIQAVIDAFRLGDFQNADGVKSLDYALNDVEFLGIDKERANFLFAGERNLMYKMFRKIYLNEKEELSGYFNLFYAYLLIKEGIRSELIQSNKNVGFTNFQRYQSRKGDLLADAIYASEFTRLAVSEGILSGNIRRMEVRIAPKLTVEEDYKYINRLDQMLLPDESWKSRLFYTVHFIKAADQKLSDTGYIYCRHYRKRKELEQRAKSLTDLRERYPYVGERILGIDAAANEIGCRPEVSASIFRYLKKHRHTYQTANGRRKLPQLNATYHVGEDFLDLTDGLRAIEEAVVFLNLGSGDRLGHALALGIDVQDWYEKKNYTIALPRQDYLDNLVWVYHKLFEYDIKGFENLKEWIQSEFSVQFNELYSCNISRGEVRAILQSAAKRTKTEYHDTVSKMLNMDIFSYYHSWQVRGDEPELYELGFFDERKYLEKQEDYRVNFLYPENFELRRLPEIAMLYYMYHYNGKIREYGSKTVEVHVQKNYADAAVMIQKAMQREIAKRGIAIETNPSSNFMIGTFRQYEKHPIFQFYNKGLVNDPNLLRDCPQISVSINTDDQGVFSTSLENEYALIASALEAVTNRNNIPIYHEADIYDWLDRVRIMGNEQSFGNLTPERDEWEEDGGEYDKAYYREYDWNPKAERGTSGSRERIRGEKERNI